MYPTVNYFAKQSMHLQYDHSFPKPFCEAEFFIYRVCLKRDLSRFYPLIVSYAQIVKRTYF